MRWTFWIQSRTGNFPAISSREPAGAKSIGPAFYILHFSSHELQRARTDVLDTKVFVYNKDESLGVGCKAVQSFDNCVVEIKCFSCAQWGPFVRRQGRLSAMLYHTQIRCREKISFIMQVHVYCQKRRITSRVKALILSG